MQFKEAKVDNKRPLFNKVQESSKIFVFKVLTFWKQKVIYSTIVNHVLRKEVEKHMAKKAAKKAVKKAAPKKAAPKKKKK